MRPQWLRHHRSIFISDVHLGTRGCKAAMLLDFLQHNDCETLYLVGGIVDGWALKRGWFWDAAHSDVVNAALAKAKAGTRVIYIPGNHDELFRDYSGLVFAGIELQREAVYITAAGKSLLVVHGDRFDGVLNYARWLAFLGDRAYAAALVSNTYLNAARRRLGLPYWSLAAFLKHNVKKAAAFICDFEQAVAREAKSRGYAGAICGHIHHPVIKDVGGVLYCNGGDWVESCTALVEDKRGWMDIVRWESVDRAAPEARASQMRLPIRAMAGP